ncbi:hypothetical protein [Streptomyces niveus]
MTDPTSDYGKYDDSDLQLDALLAGADLGVLAALEEGLDTRVGLAALNPLTPGDVAAFFVDHPVAYFARQLTVDMAFPLHVDDNQQVQRAVDLLLSASGALEELLRLVEESTHLGDASGEWPVQVRRNVKQGQIGIRKLAVDAQERRLTRACIDSSVRDIEANMVELEHFLSLGDCGPAAHLPWDFVSSLIHLVDKATDHLAQSHLALDRLFGDIDEDLGQPLLT